MKFTVWSKTFETAEVETIWTENLAVNFPAN